VTASEALVKWLVPHLDDRALHHRTAPSKAQKNAADRAAMLGMCPQHLGASPEAMTWVHISAMITGAPARQRLRYRREEMPMDPFASLFAITLIAAILCIAVASMLSHHSS